MSDTPIEDQTTDTAEPEVATAVATSGSEDTTAVDPEPDDQADEDTPPSRQAAKWRTKFREAETRIGELATQVEALQRHHIESLLTNEDITPKAFWRLAELKDMISDDGFPDPAKVSAAARGIRESLGITEGLFVPAEGYSPSTPAKPSGRQQWDQAFQPPTQRAR